MKIPDRWYDRFLHLRWVHRLNVGGKSWTNEELWAIVFQEVASGKLP